MKNRNKYIRYFVSYILSLGFLLLISVVLFAILYKFEFRYIYISNSLFIPNIIIFFISIGVNLGAGNIFSPLNYTFNKFFNLKKTKQLYDSYADYIEHKRKDIKNYWYITLANLSLMLAAYVFAIYSS